MTTAELRELLAKATPGPWEWSENGNILGHMPNGYEETREVAAVYSERDDDLAPINAQLILAMHEALPALLAAAEERDALLRAVDFDAEALAARLAESEARAEGLADALRSIAEDCRRGADQRGMTPAGVQNIARRCDAAIAQEAEREAGSA